MEQYMHAKINCYPKPKNFLRFFVTSNLATHA